MSVQVPESISKEISVNVPVTLLNRMEDIVPTRQRSHFIVEALAKEIALREQFAAIEESAGAWSDENYPELQTSEDIDHWLYQLRNIQNPEYIN